VPTIAPPAEHHHHEGVDDVSSVPRWLKLSICDSATAAIPAIPEPRPKVSASTLRCDPHHAGIPPVLRHALHLNPQLREASARIASIIAYTAKR